MGTDVEPGLIPRAIAEYESARRGKLDVPGWVGEQIGWLTAAGPLFGLAGKIPGVKQLAPGIRKSVTEAGIVGAGLGLTEPAQTPLERVEHAGERAAGFAVFVGALHGLGKAGEQLFARFRRLTSAQQTELDTNLKIIFEKEPKKVTPERVETELAKAETKVTPAGVKGKGLLDLNTKDWKTSPEDLGYSLWTGEKSYQGNLPTLYAEKGGKVFEFDNNFRLWAERPNLNTEVLKKIATPKAVTTIPPEVKAEVPKPPAEMTKKEIQVNPPQNIFYHVGKSIIGREKIWLSKGATALTVAKGESIFAIDVNKLDPKKLKLEANRYFTYSGDIQKDAIILQKTEPEGFFGLSHKDFVDQALSEGKPVYKGWEKDYPDLAKEYKGKEPIESAKEIFGITTNPKEAGYILPDGKMLDFSGKREGGTPGTRVVDHREISNIFAKPISGIDAMIRFEEEIG